MKLKTFISFVRMLEISLSFICAFPIESDETVRRLQGPAKYSSQTQDSLAL